MNPMKTTPRTKRFQTVTAAAALLAGLTLSAADLHSAQAAEANEVQMQVGEALDAIKDYSADKRDEAVAAGRQLMDSLDRRIEEMQARVDTASEQTSEATREKWRETKAGLIELRKNAAMRLEAMRESGSDAWSKAKQDFSDSVETLGQSIEDAGEGLDS
jgi:hypothetical protein